MSQPYRPSLPPEKGLAVIKAVTYALEFDEELTYDEQELIKDFLKSMKVEATTEAILERREKRILSSGEVIEDDFENWSGKALIERLWEHDDESGRGKLSHDLYLKLKQEIEICEQLLREQNPRPIQPSTEIDYSTKTDEELLKLLEDPNTSIGEINSIRAEILRRQSQE